jgi:hypothetical protein
MLQERSIEESWVNSALANPDWTEAKEDGTIHYIKSIEEYEGRYLRVVVNPDMEPPEIVAVFFDRRLRRKR